MISDKIRDDFYTRLRRKGRDVGIYKSAMSNEDEEMWVSLTHGNGTMINARIGHDDILSSYDDAIAKVLERFANIERK